VILDQGPIESKIRHLALGCYDHFVDQGQAVLSLVEGGHRDKRVTVLETKIAGSNKKTAQA
jgi:hypothetical protein